MRLIQIQMCQHVRMMIADSVVLFVSCSCSFVALQAVYQTISSYYILFSFLLFLLILLLDDAVGACVG